MSFQEQSSLSLYIYITMMVFGGLLKLLDPTTSLSNAGLTEIYIYMLKRDLFLYNRAILVSGEITRKT